MTALIMRLPATVFWALSYLPLQQSAPQAWFPGDIWGPELA